jgi:hypothetical protein
LAHIILIDLLDDIKPWEFVSRAYLDHLEPLQAHFHAETSHIQLTVTVQTQYISVIITLRRGFVVLAPGYSTEGNDTNNYLALAEYKTKRDDTNTSVVFRGGF